MIKDRGGFNGYNVFVFTVKNGTVFCGNEIVDKNALDGIVKSFCNGLIQSVIYQGEFENSLYEKSVNTIRLITVRKKDCVEHEIVAALQRIGCDKTAPVDNFSQGGFSALIDLETGELGPITSAFSKDQEMNQLFYDCHPDNGKKIRGKVIPNWPKIKEEIIDLTRKVPFFDYIAWDVVLKDEGIAVIETNMKSSLDPFQAHYGMRNSKLGDVYRRNGYLDH